MDKAGLIAKIEGLNDDQRKILKEAMGDDSADTRKKITALETQIDTLKAELAELSGKETNKKKVENNDTSFDDNFFD